MRSLFSFFTLLYHLSSFPSFPLSLLGLACEFRSKQTRRIGKRTQPVFFLSFYFLLFHSISLHSSHLISLFLSLLFSASLSEVTARNEYNEGVTKEYAEIQVFSLPLSLYSSCVFPPLSLLSSLLLLFHFYGYFSFFPFCHFQHIDLERVSIIADAILEMGEIQVENPLMHNHVYIRKVTREGSDSLM